MRTHLRCGSAVAGLAAALLLFRPDHEIPAFEIRLQTGGTNSPSLRYEASTACYYQVRAAGGLAPADWRILGMDLGSNGWQTWPGRLSPSDAPTYLRVLRVPLDTPRDEDGDGMDDAYELRRPALNALKDDRLEDPDHDGLVNLDECREGTDPGTADVLFQDARAGTWNELFDAYLAFRDGIHTMVVPQEWMTPERVEAELDARGWSAIESEDGWYGALPGIVYMPADSPLAVEAGDRRGVRVFESLSEERLKVADAGAMLAQREMAGAADWMEPGRGTEGYPRYLLAELSKRRVAWEVTLRIEETAVAEYRAMRIAELESEGPASGMTQESAATGLELRGVARAGGRLRLTAAYPAGFTNRLDVFCSAGLVSNDWNIAASNLPTIGQAAVSWTGSPPAGMCFYAVGDADADGDGDGMADARELLVHKTDPAAWDSDGDDLPDGWEIERGLDAANGAGWDGAGGDPDGDGLVNLDEYHLSGDPRDPGGRRGAWQPGGLLGEYFTETGAAFTRVDPQVAFSPFVAGADYPAQLFDAARCSIRWTGRLEVPQAGRYVFRIVASDQARLYLNDRLWLDGAGGSGNTATSAVSYLAADAYDARLEFVSDQPNPFVVLEWKQEDGEFQVVAADNLLHRRYWSEPLSVAISVPGFETAGACLVRQNGGYEGVYTRSAYDAGGHWCHGPIFVRLACQDGLWCLTVAACASFQSPSPEVTLRWYAPDDGSGTPPDVLYGPQDAAVISDGLPVRRGGDWPDCTAITVNGYQVGFLERNYRSSSVDWHGAPASPPVELIAHEKNGLKWWTLDLADKHYENYDTSEAGGMPPGGGWAGPRAIALGHGGCLGYDSAPDYLTLHINQWEEDAPDQTFSATYDLSRGSIDIDGGISGWVAPDYQPWNEQWLFTVGIRASALYGGYSHGMVTKRLDLGVWKEGKPSPPTNVACFCAGRWYEVNGYDHWDGHLVFSETVDVGVMDPPCPLPAPPAREPAVEMRPVLLRAGSTNPPPAAAANPTLTNAAPVFSAVHLHYTEEAAGRYDVEVSRDSGFGNLLWQTSGVWTTACAHAARCAGISYAGPPLLEGLYYWRIRFTTVSDAVGPWSDFGADWFIISDGDLDNDGLADSEEERIVQAGAHDAVASIFQVRAEDDFDGDSLSNADEMGLRLDPSRADTDDDCLEDGWELRYGLDPRVADQPWDADLDGLNDIEERALGADVNSGDSDGDRLPDAWEAKYGLNPADGYPPNGYRGDPDGDGISNLAEYRTHSNPWAYRASFPRMTLAGTFNGWNTHSHPLALVSNNHWALCINVTNPAAHEFKFVSEGLSNRWENTWGDLDPPAEQSNRVPVGVPGGRYAPHLTPASPQNHNIRILFTNAGPAQFDLWFRSDAATDAWYTVTAVTNETELIGAPALYRVTGSFCHDALGADTIMHRLPDGRCSLGLRFASAMTADIRFARGNWEEAWGDTNQPPAAGVLTGVAECGSQVPPIRLSVLPREYVWFLFDPRTGSYWVKSAGVDGDGDGWVDDQERARGCDPQVADTDGDKIPDGQDARPTVNSDNDQDGLPDDWEEAHGLRSDSPDGVDGAEGDSDQDGRTNAQEWSEETDPDGADTDGDGLSDGAEVGLGTDPGRADTDGDGLTDGAGGCVSVADGADGADLDGDGFAEGESDFGTSPLHPDTDGDGMDDARDPDPLAPNVFVEITRTFHLPEVHASTAGNDGYPDLRWSAFFDPGWSCNAATVRSVIVRGDVDDAFKIVSEDSEGYCWHINRCDGGTWDVTASVTDRRRGTFGILLYDWVDLDDDNHLVFDCDADITLVQALTVCFTPRDVLVRVGSSKTIAVAVDPPEMAGALSFHLSGGNPAVARVEVEGSSLTVWGLAEGETWLRAEYGNRICGLLPIRVGEVIVEGDASVCLGGEMQLEAYGGAAGYVWQSSDPAVAEVDGNGVVTAYQAGPATITVTDDEGVSASKDIRVVDLTALTAEGREGASCSDPLDDAVRYVGTSATERVLFRAQASGAEAGELPACWGLEAVDGTLTFERTDALNGFVSRRAPGWVVVEARCCSDACRHVKAVVVDPDLAVDSDNDGVMDELDDEVEMEAPGRIVACNDDDDDGNDIKDVEQSGAVPGEDDLSLMTWDCKPVDGLAEGVTLRLEISAGADRIRVWKDAERGEPEPLPAVFIPHGGTMPGRLYLEGVDPGTAVFDLVFLDANDTEICRDQVRVSVLKVDLVPNYDRDSDIGEDDRTKANAGDKYYFWINNDDDESADEGNDLPGGGRADWEDSSWIPFLGKYVVDSVRDLIDFFPVWVDIKDTLDVCPASEYDYVLKHSAGAFNAFINPGLTPSEADKHLFNQTFCEANANAELKHITANGYTLPTAFLDAIKNDNKGLILLEARAATQAPLVLEIKKKSDGTVICTEEMTVSIDSVEKMFRWINLRPTGGLPASTGEPSNNPDSLSNGKNVFFLHGFNVTADESRGWSAEMFKRLYWSGSKAKFWGMTWEGDVGLINALHYQEDVANALAVASNFNAQVSGVSGDKIVLGHSLGNMVVSGAIQDYGLSVSKYFMLDAAVASECYDPSVFNDATNDNYMLHEDWDGYSNKTWCSTWFRLFASPDDRETLTWKNRFPAVASVAYNFYSSGDEIFEVYHGTPGLFTGGLFHMEQYAWQKQEMFKGCGGLGGTDWAGWGFSGEYTMTEANAATDGNLRTNAVFRQEPTTMFSSNITAQVQNDIIAQGVPALSYAAGVNDVSLPGLNKNYDADIPSHKPNGWGRSGGTYDTRWLHSDLKNMAYLYTYDLFNEIVSRGGLQ